MTNTEILASLRVRPCAANCPFCSPPDLNSKAAGVALGGSERQGDCALPAADGQGVCTLSGSGVGKDGRVYTWPKTSNLDKSRRAVVAKGLTVDYMGLRLRVQRVRLGMFWGVTLIKNSPVNFPCAWVRVVA